MSSNGFSLFFAHSTAPDAAGVDTGSVETITLESAVTPMGAISITGCRAGMD